MFDCRVINHDFTDYDTALALMRRLAAARTVSGPEVLILTEHEPVLTLGRRGRDEDILVPRDVLDGMGIATHRIERGGLVTYHGPGQLVVYPIFGLRTLGLGVASLVDGLEEAIITTLAGFALNAARDPAGRGVWVQGAKIASIGLAVRRGVSFHGLALNRDPDLRHFDLITPCGLTGVQMTSMARLLGRPIPADELRTRLADGIAEIFHLRPQPWTPAQAEAWAGSRLADQPTNLNTDNRNAQTSLA